MDAKHDLNPIELDAMLADGVLRTIPGLRAVALLSVGAFTMLLWRLRPDPWPLAWGVVSGAAGLAWAYTTIHYTRHVRKRSPARRSHFARRVLWLWGLNSALWGGSALLIRDVPFSLGLLTYWLALGNMGAVAASALSRHKPTLRVFIHSFVGSITFAYAINLLSQPSPWEIEDGLILIALLIYWYMLTHISQGLHRLFLTAATLQQRNALLIQSLSARTQELQGALDARRRFLAMATHDIRQPVHALRLYAEMLSQEPSLVDELSQRIVQSSMAVNQLFDNLFDLARLDWHRMQPSFAPVHLASLLSSMELQIAAQARGKDLTLRLRISRRLENATVSTDPLMLQRILGNLITNAIRYTRKGGVLLTLRGTPLQPRFEVWDTGIGIAAQDQDRIFQEFFKHPNITGTHEGFGLGLPIVQQLARQLNCTISLRSRLGHGSVFRISLPPCM
ncbi:MAG: HAMP domain-containing sensor histidine kinase [Pseudomonadota bacterium]|nr:HAMP domain-containing sensor histidine kinase [Pseudomonadota bacterium]